MIQWGTYSVAANSTTNPSFPTSFPTNCIFAGLTGGRNDSGAQDNNPHVSGHSTSGFNIFNAADTGLISDRWIAFGY